MITLYGAAATGLTLAEAVEGAHMSGGCALLTTPSAYHIARVDGRDCTTPEGSVDLAVVYEARVFTFEAELRWVESGYGVLLTEDEHRLPSSFTEPVPTIAATKVLDTGYLIWGTASAATSGWTRLDSRRVRNLTIPMAASPETDRVRLLAREYVAVEPDHGNAYVAEERLIGFEPYSAEGTV